MNMTSLDLNLLILFETIYTNRSISRAATILDMNQPTVSNALARLRKQLDDPLFVRNGRGVSPTSRADTIIKPVRRALADIRSITDLPEGPFDPLASEREFRLYMIDVLEPFILPTLIETAVKSKGMRLRFIPPQVISCEDAVLDGIVDLGVGIQPERRPGLKWEELCPMDLVIIARKGHPEIDGEITPHHIKTLRHVVLDLEPLVQAPGAAANMRNFKLKRKLQFNHVLRVARPSAIPLVVSQSDLIGFTPRLYAEAMCETLGLQIFETPQPIAAGSYYLVWREELEDDISVQWLRGLFLEKTAHLRVPKDVAGTG